MSAFVERFSIVVEPDAGDCEWDTFVVGTECDNGAAYAVVDSSDTKDSDYPQGFHAAHLCGEHVLPGLREMRASE